MTTALISGSSVLAVYDGWPPTNVLLANGQNISSTPPYPLPVTFPDGSQLVSASYTDTAPINSVSTGVDLVAWTVNNGIASGPRNWQTVAPLLITQISPLEFRARFTPVEQTAIFTAALGNAQLLGTLLAQAAAQYIDLADPQTIAGVNALASAGLITTDRAAAILKVQAD